ncbi:MAG: hypothetical protein ACXVXZ_08345, partial [Mycobacteriaceae bacterium]
SGSLLIKSPKWARTTPATHPRWTSPRQDTPGGGQSGVESQRGEAAEANPASRSQISYRKTHKVVYDGALKTE